MNTKILEFLKSQRFMVISWVVTVVIVIGLLGGTFWWTTTAATAPAMVPEPTAVPDQNPAPVALPAADPAAAFHAIGRLLNLKTNIPERPRYEVIEYTVARGDSVFAIAGEFKVTPETVLWANYDTLNDDPHNLKPGQELNVPPVDGIYYQWQESDTLESVASKYEAKPDDITNWPGNDLDLTNPEIKPGSWVMLPDGKRELIQPWIQSIAAVGESGTASTAAAQCGGGLSGPIAAWPTDGRYVSGNDFWSGHLAIDLAANEGVPVYAAGSGVVIMSQDGWNYGYGNVIEIDHGNGYQTLYAHLSQRNVSKCQSVYAGDMIGLAGSTGNSTGAHLHFEVRLNGDFVNPWHVLP